MSEEVLQTQEIEYWDERFDPNQIPWSEETIAKYFPLEVAQEFKAAIEIAARNLGETPQRVFFLYLLKAENKPVPAGRYSEKLIQEIEGTIQAVLKQESA